MACARRQPLYTDHACGGGGEPCTLTTKDIRPALPWGSSPEELITGTPPKPTRKEPPLSKEQYCHLALGDHVFNIYQGTL